MSDPSPDPKSETVTQSDEPSPALHRLHLWQIQALRDVLVIACCIFIFFIGYWLRSVTVPLLLALAIAYVVEPLVQRACRRWKLSRPVVVGGAVGILAFVTTVAVIILVPLLVIQTVDFIKILNEQRRDVHAIVEQLPESVRLMIPPELLPLKPDEDEDADEPNETGTSVEPTTIESGDPGSGSVDGDLPVNETELVALPDGADPPGLTPAEEEFAGKQPSQDGSIQAAERSADLDSADTDVSAPPRQRDERLAEWIRENVSSIFQFTVNTTGEAVNFLGGIIGSLIYTAFLIFLIPFYFYCFSVSWPDIREFVSETLPREHFEREYDLLQKMNAAVAGFVRGRIVISVIMGIMLAIGWAICGVPYWLIVGMLTGVLCAVPYLGGLGVPVAIVLLWLSQGGFTPNDDAMAWWGILLWPTLVFGIVQLIEGYILTPVIAGKATGLGPVSILVAVLAGAAVMGVYGMLLAIPAMACIRILFLDVALPRIKSWARGQAEDILPISEDLPRSNAGSDPSAS